VLASNAAQFAAFSPSRGQTRCAVRYRAAGLVMHRDLRVRNSLCPRALDDWADLSRPRSGKSRELTEGALSVLRLAQP